MNKWPKPNYKELIDFYGDPDINGDGLPDIEWERENLVYIEPPYTMYWSWSGEKAKRLKVHKKCSQSLLKALSDIPACHTQETIKQYQLDQCGGVYNFRLMRGGNQLSMHSYGCAIDLAPVANGLGKKWVKGPEMMPLSVVVLFAAEGWKWGGNWSRPDSMHFEATS